MQAIIALQCQINASFSLRPSLKFPPLSRRALLAGAGTMLAAEPVKLPHKVRVGIAGLEGHVGEITGPLKQLPDVEIVAIADDDPATLDR